MKKTIKIFKTVLLGIAGLIVPKLVFAGVMLDRAKTIAANSYETVGTDEYSLSKFVGTIVNVALGLLGVLFVILTIYAGLLWMTSAGDEEKIKKSTGILKASIIGLLIVVASYAVWNFLLYKLIAV
jgi:preprotein translocase subunit SecG